MRVPLQISTTIVNVLQSSRGENFRPMMTTKRFMELSKLTHRHLKHHKYVTLPKKSLVGFIDPQPQGHVHGLNPTMVELSTENQWKTPPPQASSCCGKSCLGHPQIPDPKIKARFTVPCIALHPMKSQAPRSWTGSDLCSPKKRAMKSMNRVKMLLIAFVIGF